MEKGSLPVSGADELPAGGPRSTSPWGVSSGFLAPLVFSALALLAYTCATPFRDLYGLEARNALMAREMLDRGVGFLPTVFGRHYLDYPPLYFWIEVLFSKFPGHVTTTTAVLPSALAASGLVFLAWLFGRLHGNRSAWTAVILLATLPDFWIHASHATIDMLLAFNCALAVYCFLRGEEGTSGRGGVSWTLGGLAATAASFLTKGPVGIVLPTGIWGIYLLWDRRWRSLAIFIALMAIWAGVLTGLHFAFIWKAGGRELVEEVIRRQVFQRVGGEANKPLWYYPLHLAVVVSPWVLWLISFARQWIHSPRKAQVTFWERSTGSGVPLLRLAWIWVGVVFGIFLFASSRHGRYLLPLHLPLCLLLAFVVEWTDREGNFPRGRGWERFFSALVWLALGAGTVSLVFLGSEQEPPWPCFVFWTVLSVGGWLGIRRRVPRQWNRCAAFLALALATGVMGFQVLWEPTISRKESGRSFVETLESRAPLEWPVVFYGISSDGDGIKFALYSRRQPESLIFTSSAFGLKAGPKPSILVFFEKQRPALTEVLSSCPASGVASGFVHSRPVAALVLERPCE